VVGPPEFCAASSLGICTAIRLYGLPRGKP